MAKVKSAKQRITAFLSAKGYDASEIKDAFDELDAADVDLESAATQLAEATQKNGEWTTWYNKIAPEVQTIAAERDMLRQRMSELEKAGVKFDLSARSEVTADKVADGQYVTPAEFQKFKQELAGATSVIMKGLTRVSTRHYKEFNEEPDLDAIEQLVSEKGYSVEDAYNFWSQPKRDERKSKEVDEKIRLGIQEGLKAELSKAGIRTRRAKNPDDVDLEPITKVVERKDSPSEHQLRDSFISDLNSETTH